MYLGEWTGAAASWLTAQGAALRAVLPSDEGDFWTAIGAIITAFAAVVALSLGVTPLILDWRRRKAEALLQAAEFVMLCHVPAAALRAVSVVLSDHGLDKFSVHHCDMLSEAVRHAAMPALAPEDLHRLSILIGRKRAIALAVAFGTVASMIPRIEALRISCEIGIDQASLHKYVSRLLQDANGASDVLREVRRRLELKLGRQM